MGMMCFTIFLLNAVAFYSCDFIRATNILSNGSSEFLFQLKGKIGDVPSSIEEIDKFNNNQIYPRISSLVLKDYFRFFKVNLKRLCPFWRDTSHCAMRHCQVESCKDETVPVGIKDYYNSYHEPYINPSLKYSEQSLSADDCDHEEGDNLGYLNTTISASTMKDLELWQAYDDAQDLFCYLSDHDEEAQYVDLKLNPERYTGYRGEPAHKVWRVIYKENCFRPENIYEVYIQSSKLSGMCIEKRAFYRAVSGLHASINIHLSAQYLQSDKNSKMLNACNIGIWGPNINELIAKFSPERTNEQGPEWLRNLYFLYAVEMRALAKISYYLEDEEYYTGNEKEDAETKSAVFNLLDMVKSFPNHFKESEMFAGSREQLKEEFRRHFRNISSIMDCVGCDKCKLWGKLQVRGLGTAFKILFSGKFDEPAIAVSRERRRDKSFHLERGEIVALFNAFARLSTSIYELEKFRNVLRKSS